jgi:hypothetical protein
VRAGDSVVPEQLYRLPDGRLWTYTNPLGHTVYGARHVTEALKRLPKKWQLNDAADPWLRARLFDEVAQRTLDCVVGITKVGILTPTEPGRRGRPNPPSIDYLCFGDPATELWEQLLLSAIVRRLPTDVDELVKDKYGFVHLMITITPRAAKWQRVVAGKLIDDSTTTHVLNPGDRFDPTQHCDWAPKPDLPPFRPDSYEDLF